jgi:hypothetical protein
MQAFANLFSQNRNKLILITGVPVPAQYNNIKQLRWISALSRVAVAANNTFLANYFLFSNLSFSDARYMGAYVGSIGGDNNSIYTSEFSVPYSVLRKWPFNWLQIGYVAVANAQMIDASGDPDYVYVTSNNVADHHGFRQVKKSTMAVTASALADGSGNGQFDDPLGIFYYNSEIFVADYDNSRISVWTKSGETLTYARKYDLGFKPRDLAFDGTHWYVQSATNTYKYDNIFTDATKVSTACVGYSLTVIPDQGDGNGATLAISDNTNSRLYRRKCSDLSLIATVGSSGDGSSSLCDPVITGPAGTWRDSEGNSYAVTSGNNISKNGFSGDFFRSTPSRMTYQPTGKLSDITAIDFNADAIVGEIKNLHKCVNLTSLKLQTNPALILNLSQLSAKLQTLWAYACGAGISGSIRHMTALTDCRLRENASSVAQVDAWVEDLWANRDILSMPNINMNGTNLSPTGTFQYAETPSTPKEKIYSLINDYMWTFVFTM